jgi:uncharacterized protein YdhG (YjbR/CyaY superfamily)
MKARTNRSSNDASASQQIDAMLRELGDCRGDRLSQLRALIKNADRDVVEEVKWKKPSNPTGVPVWSHDGIDRLHRGSAQKRRQASPKVPCWMIQRSSSTRGWTATPFAHSTSARVTRSMKTR